MACPLLKLKCLSHLVISWLNAFYCEMNGEHSIISCSSLSVTHKYFVTKSTSMPINNINSHLHIKNSRTLLIGYSGFISCEWFGGHTKHKYLLPGQTSILSNKTITYIIYDYYKSGFFELDPATCMIWRKVTHLTRICRLTRPVFNLGMDV